jgi:phosphonate transport system substrate-binding protein
MDDIFIMGLILYTRVEPDIQNQPHDEDIIHFYLTPSVSEELVRSKGQRLVDFLGNETGLSFKLHVPKNYDQMIEDFGTGKADVAIMNSLSYVKANEDFGVSARLRAIRYGRSTYFGQIIVNADKGIETVRDLQDKTIAYTDRSSTSGYLFPQKILKESGVKPGKTVFAGQHDKVVKMVYEGIVDAGATFYSEPAADGSIRDARARIIDSYPDVTEKVKIIKVTEPIPNDPVVFSSQISQEKAYEIALGLIKFVSSEQGKSTMMDLYSTEGFVRCSDADYDMLRQALKE